MRYGRISLTGEADTIDRVPKLMSERRYQLSRSGVLRILRRRR